MAADRSRLAAALDYLERIKRQAVDFGGGVASNVAERAKSAGGLAFEALTSDPNIGRMTTAEFSQAAADRQTPRLDQAAQDLGTIGRAIVTQPIQTGKAIVQGEIERAQGAMQSPRAAGEYAGSFIDPVRMAAALRKTGPVMAELDVYHGTPHRFPATEANPLGEFDASKIGTGEGAQAYGHGIYLAEAKDVADQYANMPKFKLGVVENAQELGNNAKSFVERVEKFGSVEKAKVEAQELLREMQKQNIFPAVQQQLANEIDVANKLEKKIKVKATGIEPQVYKADLPDEMIDRMLDWDKPLIEQNIDLQRFAPEMRKRIQSIPSSFGTLDAPLEVAADMLKSKTGLELYKMLVEQYGDKAASQKLKDAGIPGIKYLDAGSRGQGGSGTRNFVVFPGEEKKVRILERDGKKVADMLQRAAPISAQVEVDIYPLRSDPNTLYLSKIAVPKDQQGQGLGSQAMQEIIDKADAEGKRVVLSPSTEYGASSVGRLKDFYKRFGFVENKGRNKNYAISESMYRDPKKSK